MRVTVLSDDGVEVVVVLTKNHAASLGIEQDVHVWVTPVAGATTVPRMHAVTG